jgi:hypothetical protein
MARPSSTGRVRKKDQPSNALTVEPIRVTCGHRQKLTTYLAQNEGKKKADAWRDILNAGFRALGVSAPPSPAIAGSIGLAPQKVAA